MRKTLTIIAGLSLLFTACSKSGGSGGTPITPSTKYYAKAIHHGIISEVIDTLGCALNGTVFLGGGSAYATIDCFKSVYKSDGFGSSMMIVAEKRSSLIGTYNIASEKTGSYTTFSYWKGGVANHIGVAENKDTISKLTIKSIDSDAIIGTAYLKLNDGTFADIEFRVRNTQ